MGTTTEEQYINKAKAMIDALVLSEKGYTIEGTYNSQRIPKLAKFLAQHRDVYLTTTYSKEGKALHKRYKEAMHIGQMVHPPKHIFAVVLHEGPQDLVQEKLDLMAKVSALNKQIDLIDKEIQRCMKLSTVSD
jgi:hypothetical protein